MKNKKTETSPLNPNFLSPTPNLLSPSPNPFSPIPNPSSPIPNPSSPIPNPSSPIPNPSSPIPTSYSPSFGGGWGEDLSPIYHMLMEMAAGHFTLKIDKSEIDDELQQLEKLVQLIATELRKNIYYKGFITSHFALQYLVQNTFVLNKNFVIKSYNIHSEKSLNLEPDFLQDYKFENILSESSKLLWEMISKEISSNRLFHKTIQLEYQIKSASIIPTFSTITRLLHSNKIIISSLSIVLENDTQINPILLNLHNKKESTLKYDNVLINDMYNFILQNLDSPLPPLKDLAAKFATNEHKLKDGFKYFFKTSIYKFYNDERLKRAHLLIQQTKLPLKNIADMSGFNIYSNFSKAFKKQFTYPPSQVKRSNYHQSP